MAILKKLTLVAIVAVCAVCLAFGIAGCDNGEGHVHTFYEEWTRTETEHWHAANCGHTTQKSGYGKHVDANDDGMCDKCDYELRHTYSELWLPEGEEGHYHAATCHDGVKSAVEPHDYDENFKCKLCDYQHVHTFDLSHWAHDESTHWHAADCGHEVKQDETAHVDSDDDQWCDDCGEYVPHRHKFDETVWLYDANMHWHPSTCHPDDAAVKGGEAEHTFTAGVCDCGVTEAEKQAYNTLVEQNIVQDTDFYTWLTGIKADGVTEVQVNASGDIIYEKSSGSQTVYTADRIIKIKAEDQNKQPVVGAYLKVVYMKNGEEQKYGATNAIAIGVTDENGVASLKFSLLGGFSSSLTEYKVCIAEALDIAAILGGDEEDYFAIPNRYKLKLADDEMGAQEIAVDIQQDTDFSDVLSTPFEFEYSKAWSAYHTIYLPYRRYWENQLEGTGICEDGTEPYTFTLSGDGLYDYLYFSPQKYDYKQGGTIEQNKQIIENAQIAASGYYKISFEVENNVPAELYFWNGCDDLGAAENTMFVAADGTPYRGYITAISGGEADVDKHTGGNFIYVNIPTTDLALKLYQLGIKSDVAAKVTITVTREDEYQFFPDYTFVKDDMLSEQGSDVYVVYEARFTRYGYTPTVFDLKDVPEGVYELSIPGGSTTQFIYAYFGEENGSNEIQLNYYDDFEDKVFKNYIKIDESNRDKYLSIYITFDVIEEFWKPEVKLTACEFPTLAGDGIQVFVPTTKDSQSDIYNIDLSAAAGSYTLNIVIRGRGLGVGSSSDYVIIATIGGREYTLDFVPGRYSGSNAATSTFTGTVEVFEGDTTISLQTHYTLTGSDKANKYLAKATLTPVAD